jgi:hypothetical protein
MSHKGNAQNDHYHYHGGPNPIVHNLIPHENAIVQFPRLHRHSPHQPIPQSYEELAALEDVQVGLASFYMEMATKTQNVPYSFNEK